MFFITKMISLFRNHGKSLMALAGSLFLLGASIMIFDCRTPVESLGMIAIAVTVSIMLWMALREDLLDRVLMWIRDEEK